MEDLERFQVQMRNLTVHELLGYRARKKPLPLLVGLFDYLREQGAFLHAVLGSGGDVGFGPRLRDSLCTNLVQSVSVSYTHLDVYKRQVRRRHFGWLPAEGAERIDAGGRFFGAAERFGGVERVVDAGRLQGGRCGRRCV